MTTDFTELLNQTASEAERPKPLPPGLYRARITGIPNNVTSREKQTPGLEFVYALMEAGEDVDIELLEEATENRPLAQRQMKETFWITPDSMYRLKEFFEKLGLDTDRPFKEVLPDVVNSELMLSISQSPSRKEAGVLYNQIDNHAGVEGV